MGHGLLGAEIGRGLGFGIYTCHLAHVNRFHFALKYRL